MTEAKALFLIHWNGGEAENLAAPLREEGWAVEVEAEDGARAVERIRDQAPAAVVIFLRRLPSHGRETAHALRAMKATRHVPILFVDGEEEKLARVRERVPDAVYTTAEQLPEALGDL